jgi:hypothetical protein
MSMKDIVIKKIKEGKELTHEEQGWAKLILGDWIYQLKKDLNRLRVLKKQGADVEKLLNDTESNIEKFETMLNDLNKKNR